MPRIKNNLIIAIDGTAGSGKSTTAQGAAKKLGFFYLNTGAMYRAITYKILKHNVDINNIKALNELLNSTTIEVKQTKNYKSLIFIDGIDVSQKIQTPEIDAMVSLVSQIPLVRKKMVKEQRRLAKNRNIIVEGRDIGTVVFPNADLKFFITCAIDQRTARRKKQLQKKGRLIPHREIKNNLITRDLLDSTRETSPLKCPKDAICLDTTKLTIKQEIDFVVKMIKNKIDQKSAK
ncbi:MAG: (d)CMP kinase [candidate division WOR-3 bacterium]